jgi:hypothetical protein
MSFQASAQASSCTAPSNWFPHSQTPEQDSAGFSSSSNCEFHQWSWNAFLWLTQDVDGEPRFARMTPDGIQAPGGALDPLIGRSGKARALDLINQAGPDGIMVDQNGSPIYYSIHSNATFGKFIADNHLFDPDKLRTFNPDTPFPVDSLTLKAAWKVVAPGEDVSTYYTRKAEVALLTTRNGKITLATKQVDGKDVVQTREVDVALVGFHVAGTVNGHPEMIWATFEHNDNAPDLPKPMDQMAPSEVVSDRDWTFYKKGTPFKDCNVNAAGAGALTLDEKAQTLAPVTEVCRMVPYGGGDPSNVANIKSLNDSVHAQLADVWKNYFEVGAIWFLPTNALKPNCTFQPGSLQCPPKPGSKMLTGSVQLSNATVETFTQSQSAQDNCFACHNTVQVTAEKPWLKALPGMNVDISHVLINEYFKAQDAKQSH